jgi:Tfp pilus assembly protein PilN
MKAVNLLPANRRPGHRSTEQNQARATTVAALVGGAVLALVTIVVAVAGLQGRSAANEKQGVLDAIKAELGAAQSSAAAAAQAKAQYSARFSAFSTASSGRIQWDGLLHDLSRVMPADSWLTNLTARSPVAPAADVAPGLPAPVSTSEGLLIIGFARTQSVVPLVLDRLALIPTLSDVGLQRSQLIAVGDRKAVQFTIGANVSVGGGNR